MTDDTHHHLDDVEDRSEDHQQAVEACQHALDALSNGDLSSACRERRTLAAFQLR